MNKAIVLLAVLMLSACHRAPPPPKPAEYPARFAELANRQHPNNRPINIVFHGNSVPAGYMHTPVIDSLAAYPHQLHRTLKEAYPYAQFNIIVTATGGDISAFGAERFGQVLAHQPDVVVLDYGLNDRQIEMDASIGAMADMIRRARDHGAMVVVMTPSPDMAETGNDLERQAIMLRALAHEYDVALCDSYAAFDGLEIESLMAQSNHPNAKGHAVIELELRRFFVPLPQ